MVLSKRWNFGSDFMKGVYAFQMDPVQLFEDYELPPEHREIAIVSGYRHPTRNTLKQCCQSAFALTNETLNFWTHFLPTFYFCWRLTEFIESMKMITDTYTWAFAAYMLSVCLYPLISALAHLFYCMSNFSRNFWFFMDYGALSFYSFGAGLIYRAYAFPTDLLHTRFSEIFLYVCAFNTLLCTGLACWSRFVISHLWIKVFRLGAFFLPWAWDSIPLLYRFFHPNSLLEDIDSQTMPYYRRQFIFSLMLGFFYATHFPERLAPGKFDIIGNSHQLLHICGVLATNEQMNGALYDLKVRQKVMEFSGIQTPLFWCKDVVYAVLVINFLIILTFSLFAWKMDRKEHKELRVPAKKQN